MATDMINSLKIGSDVHVLSLPYGACTTAADATAKTVSVDNFSLETGAHVSIKFNNANTATSPTLNVNSTGAKTIYYRGADLNTDSLAKQLQGIIEFVYNGTQWEVVGNLDTDTNTKSFTITANASDDDVVVLSGTNGSNAVTYSASHAKKGPSSGYTSGNTTTSISGSGGSGTIKIPQITVDTYGHVTAGADESVTITLPTIPALSETPSTDTSTIKPTGSAKSKTFTAITALGTNNHTITDTTTTYTLDLSEFATTAEISTAMVFKGSLGTNGTITSLPTAAAALVGDTYKVITAGTYANIAAKVGDVFICSPKPEWVLIPAGDEPSGTVTSIATSGDITGGTITTSGTISHKASGVTAGSYGPSANATPAVGGTFSVPYLTVNANGHVTAASTKTITIPNHNAFSNVKVGDTTIAADTTTDTLTLVGSNVTITPDATNDKVTFSVADGSTSGKGLVQLTNSTSSTSTTTAATPNSVKSAYDLANTAKTNAATAQTKADSAYALAESKVDSLSDLGITATATELNYVAGVTSNIQTQLNAKGTSNLIIGTTSTTAAAGNHTHKYAGSSSAGGAANSANALNAIKIASGSDLNSFTTCGFYYVSSNADAASIAHSPTTKAFFMIVGKHAGTYQEVVSYLPGSPTRYMRNMNNDSWGNWFTVMTSNTLAGTSPGVVKSGGDVTISDGIIAVNKATLLKPTDNTSTVSIAVSSWAANSSDGKIVWREAFKESSYGTDTGDIVLWVNKNTAANGTELNMTIDGNFYAEQNKLVLHSGNYSTYCAPAYKYQTTDPGAGSALETGKLLIVYS